MQKTFQLLKRIEQKCLESAHDMPSADGAIDDWSGIGFRVAQTDLLARMGEVTEILDIPPYTKVPGVKPWVVGIANVRGGLLPLMDLNMFITGESIEKLSAGRVMVVNHKGLLTGLIVEEVQGLRRFPLSDQAFELPEVSNHLRSYIKKAFQKDEVYWPVFSMYALVEDERFLHVSL